MNVPVLAEDGSTAGNAELLDVIFGVKPSVSLVHQAVTAQLAAARSGTHSTKTRAEVRGGGRKPWRQKGTGRARHGSIREPQWVGGGIAFGPKPRSHAKSLNKKMRALALRSSLSARAAEQRVLVVDRIGFEKPSTKRAMAALAAWKADGRVLLVLTRDDPLTAYAFRNIPAVHYVTQDQLNTYDVVRAATVVFTREALDEFQTRAADLPGRRAKAVAARADATPDVVREQAPEPVTAAPAEPDTGGETA